MSNTRPACPFCNSHYTYVLTSLAKPKVDADGRLTLNPTTGKPDVIMAYRCRGCGQIYHHDQEVAKNEVIVKSVIGDLKDFLKDREKRKIAKEGKEPVNE